MARHNKTKREYKKARDKYVKRTLNKEYKRLSKDPEMEEKINAEIQAWKKSKKSMDWYNARALKISREEVKALKAETQK